MRIERAAAMLWANYFNAHRKQGSEPVSIHTFMPNADEQPTTLDEAMQTWR